MPVLEVCRRRLNGGVPPNDPALKAVLPQIRANTGCQYVFYSAMEEPEAFFQIGEWPSLATYKEFSSSPDSGSKLQALDSMSKVEWIEFIPIDRMSRLPLEAPVMTVSRCFFKEYDDHPQIYYKKFKALHGTIESETKPWRYVADWTVDTTPEQHVWLAFGGYRSKKHHQVFATRLKVEVDFFDGIPEHYEEGTVHRHCWDMEEVPEEAIFETMQGFIPQKITKGKR